MNNKIHNRVIPILVIVMIVLSACAPNGTGGNTTEAQVQTMAAATVAAYVNQSLTQTASGPLYVVITSTPEPTATNTTAPILPTLTNTPNPTATLQPTKTAVPIPCNAAAFVEDVTVKDGTAFMAGEKFVKTWRIRNIGSCNWTTDYQLYFYGGSQMNGPSAVNLSKTIHPNETVDISITLTAPGDPDSYTGKWMLRSGSGTIFGVGNNAPLTVVIKVSKLPDPKDANTVYDFVKNYCKAVWKTSSGTISCPSSELSFRKGSIMRTYAPILENGQVDDEGTLITIPDKGSAGMIQGQYPAFTVHDGDHIMGLLFCSSGMNKCNVTFEVLAREKGTDTVTSLGTWEKKYGDSSIHLDIDLSAMDGKDMIFYLKVSSNGDSTNDYAQWMAIRITHP